MRKVPTSVWMRLLPLLVLGLGVPAQASAGWFGESEKEKAAKVAAHVADLLREPNLLIAQAQNAAEAGDTEGAISLFRQAQTLLEQAEAAEDTSGSAFATLRLKKFHCISMLDALALKRAEVMDVRQAVTDTSDLEARLAKERAALEAKNKPKKTAEALPTRPPTLAEQLQSERQALKSASTATQAARVALVAAQADVKRAQEAVQAAAQANTAADAKLFLADQNAQKWIKQLGVDSPEAQQAREVWASAHADAMKAKQAWEQAKVKQAQAEEAQRTAEANVNAALNAEATIYRGVEVLERAEKKARAEQEAKARVEAKKRAEEAERARKKAEAEAAAKRQAQQEAEKKAQEAAKQAKAEADAKAAQEALKGEIDWCYELWRQKNVEVLERRLTEATAKHPDTPEFLLLLARLRLMQGQREDAVEIAGMIPEKGKLGVQAQLVIAGAYLSENRTLEAMKLLEKVMRSAPQDPAPYFNMAVVMTHLPDIDPKGEVAAKYYRRSVELGGKRSQALEERLSME